MADGIATAAAAFKSKMVDVASTLWATTAPELLVSYGRLGANMPENCVVFGGVGSEQDDGPAGTNHPRDEVLTLEVEFFIFRSGEVNAEREATEYLYARLGELERYVRITNTTLDGLVRKCLLARHYSDTGEMSSADGTQGRLAAAIAEFTATLRISS